MTPDDLEPFDLTGALPRGTTVLEASAGTGKTFTIAGLAARWVAEAGVRLPDLLVVTFTRAATAELRDRVRRRLVDGAEHLEAVLSATDRGQDDAVLARLADAPPGELRRRHERLTRALSEIDVATISTIHGFCQHVLDGLGIASDLDREAELVEDLSDLIEEVVDDLLVTTYLEPSDRPRLSRDELVALGRVVVANPTTPLVPTGPEDPVAGLRLHLAHRIRTEVARRARQRRQLSYDDLLTRLEVTLRDPDRGVAARQALRERYRITLIDEFQDTDPVQWSIVSQAFLGPEEDPGRAVVLIGDPKQAIYAFRGADVYAYLDASRAAEDRRTLATNWRSDAPLLRGFDTLFAGAAFGQRGIRYREVAAAPGHEHPGLTGAPVAAPLRLRLLPRYDDLLGSRGALLADKAREVIASDVAADIVELLSAEPQRAATGAADGPATTPLAPRDIAVLVRSNAEAALVQRRLLEVGVPAVVGGVDSVFATPAATDWRRLVEALERPASSSRVRALALTSWVGWTGDDIANRTDDDWDQLHEDVHRWATVVREAGVAAMYRLVLLQRAVQPRLLAREGGERLLADLEHVAELLHASATAEHLGATGLVAWLHERIIDAADDQQDERLRRLETDDEAVQILTVHRSKGLEFPVVYCPFLWSSNTRAGSVPVFHDGQRERRVDVGGSDHPGFADSQAREEDEARGEELRLVYVAMTRARHQVVAWYAPAGNADWSGLARLLLCRSESGDAETHREAPRPDDDEIRAAVVALADRASGAIAVETVPEAPSTEPWSHDEDTPADLDRARFTRSIDSSWRRTSYSALTRLDDPTPRVGTEPDDPVKDDEAIPDVVATADGPAAAADGSLRQLSLPLADLPGGTHVGTFVHRVLERVDFASVDLAAELRATVTAELRRVRLHLDGETVVAGLEAALSTPLGPGAGELTLTEVTRADRRDEVEFELPLDLDPGGRAATVADLATLLRSHLPSDDPLRGYADHLGDPLLGRDLRGFLGGSIDLVFRRTDTDGEPVFHVVDYKTNRLGIWGEPLTAWDYRPRALADAMTHGHYPLQALLYSVALHRMLRWRHPGYDPGRHLGSVLYLFVRGMAGPETPRIDSRPCGVFAWDLPPALVEATSDLLHGVTTSAAIPSGASS